MAPNIKRDRPIEETLIPPVLVLESAADHGTHRVISTYSKVGEGSDNEGNYEETGTASTNSEGVTPTLLEKQKKDEERQTDESKTGKSLVDSALKYYFEATSMEETSEEETKYSSKEHKNVDFLDPPLRETQGTLTTREIISSFGETVSLQNDRTGRKLRDKDRDAGDTVNFNPVVRENNPGLVVENDATHSMSLSIETTTPLITTYKPKLQIQHDNSNSSSSNSNKRNNNNTYNNNNNSNNSNNNNNNNSGITTRVSTKSSNNIPNYQSVTDAIYPTLQTNTPASPPRRRNAPGQRQEPRQRPDHLLLSTDFGHTQEELADFSNLFHHQKTLDELASPGKDVAVKGDGWLLTTEGSTAMILVGMCSIIMMLICFIFLLKKWRNQNSGKEGKERKEDMDEIDIEKEHHKSPLGRDLHIPASFLPFLKSLTHNNMDKMSDNALDPAFADVEEAFSETQLGRLWFTVTYDAEKSDLHVTVKHARYPHGRGVTSNTGELWVECRIISPMNTIKDTSKTSTRRATHSPVFNHSFIFLLSKEEIGTHILKMILQDVHPKKGNHTVGSIILPLSSIDLHSGEILCRDLL